MYNIYNIYIEREGERKNIYYIILVVSSHWKKMSNKKK